MTWIQKHKNKIIPFLKLVGYDHKQWVRTVMYERCYALINELHPERLDTLEISGAENWQHLGFKSFSTTDYPDFDICKDKLAQKFDLIIADQIFEHLIYPYRAAKNVYDMLKPGGHFLIATPFMIKIHPMPNDCTRWTETGMKYFLSECGFELDNIKTDSWGNKSCVKANMGKNWAPRGWFGSLKNHPYFPVTVWALAKK